MAGRVFVDTSAWVGLFVPTDQYHTEAREAFDALREARTSLITSDYILAETVTRVRTKAGLAVADGAWTALESGTVQLIEVEPADRREAQRIFRKYNQISLSLVDCVSMAIMERLEFREILTFDSGFRKAGFVVHPHA